MIISALAITTLLWAATSDGKKYSPRWTSLDSRPLPAWYDEAKFGIFLHWGVYSVPAYGGAWFWWYWRHKRDPRYVAFMERNYRPGFTYADFAPSFTAEFYNATRWAEVLAASGAKYVVLTSKHHEGYTNWPSKYSWNWNSRDVGPKRDLVGELATAVKTTSDMKFGLYHSLFEWFHPLYQSDKAANWTTQKYVQAVVSPQLHEIVEGYKPDVVWSDGDWEAPDTYWNSTEFIAWLYNDSPVRRSVVTNDRWGRGVTCHHGGYFTCTDKYNPGKLQPRKWENCFTVDKNYWAYRRDIELSDVLTMKNLTTILAQTVSCGGNVLMNVGPTADGRIVPIFEERLRQMGQWLSINGDAIYRTQPWTTQHDANNSDVWYTQNKAGDTVYAIVLEWPKHNTLLLGSPTPTPGSKISLLGWGPVPFSSPPAGGLVVDLSRLGPSELPSPWAWVLAMTKVEDISSARHRTLVYRNSSADDAQRAFKIGHH